MLRVLGCFFFFFFFFFLVVAGIHPSGTSMSGSFESVQWNACVLRLDLGLYSPPRVLGNEVLQGKYPLYQRLRGGSNPRRCITLDSDPNTLPTELFRHPIFISALHKTSKIFPINSLPNVFLNSFTDPHS